MGFTRRGTEPGGGQDPADRPLPHPIPQADHLTLDAPVPVPLDYSIGCVTCAVCRQDDRRGGWLAGCSSRSSTC
jgi:hypothetical protein